MAEPYRVHASHEQRTPVRRPTMPARRQAADPRGAPLPSLHAQLDPRALTPATVLALQRTIGNQATNLLISRSRARRRAESGCPPATTLDGAQTAPAVTLQRYYTPSGETNKGTRVSDSEGLILLNKKTLFASEALIAEAQAALNGVKSYVTVTGGSTKKGKALQQVGLAWNPKNVPEGSHHAKVGAANKGDRFTCGFADCHRNSQMVMGSSSGGDVDTENPVISTAAGRQIIPSTTRLEAKGQKLEGSHANRGVYAFFSHAFPEFAKTLEGNREHKVKYADLIAKLKAIKDAELGGEKVSQMWTIYSTIVKDPDLAPLFSSAFGVNEAAKPQVGDALTQVNNETERKNAPEGVDLWNFHWAGVIMKDGNDYITLENLSVEDEDVINPDWYFQMYGTGKQSFHAEQKDPGNAGSEHVGETPVTLGFRDAANVSEGARGEYAAKGKAADARKKLPGATAEDISAREELAAAKAAVEDPEGTARAAALALKIAQEKSAATMLDAAKVAREEEAARAAREEAIANIASEAEAKVAREEARKADLASKRRLATAERLKNNAEEELRAAQAVADDPAANAREKYEAAQVTATRAAQALARVTALIEEAEAALLAAKEKTAAAVKAAT